MKRMNCTHIPANECAMLLYATPLRAVTASSFTPYGMRNTPACAPPVPAAAGRSVQSPTLSNIRSSAFRSPSLIPLACSRSRRDSIRYLRNSDIHRPPATLLHLVAIIIRAPSLQFRTVRGCWQLDFRLVLAAKQRARRIVAKALGNHRRYRRLAATLATASRASSTRELLRRAPCPPPAPPPLVWKSRCRPDPPPPPRSSKPRDRCSPRRTGSQRNSRSRSAPQNSS